MYGRYRCLRRNVLPAPQIRLDLFAIVGVDDLERVAVGVRFLRREPELAERPAPWPFVVDLVSERNAVRHLDGEHEVAGVIEQTGATVDRHLELGLAGLLDLGLGRARRRQA